MTWWTWFLSGMAAMFVLSIVFWLDILGFFVLCVWLSTPEKKSKEKNGTQKMH